MSRRETEIRTAGIRCVVFFHSYQAELPFDCVADPGKQHCRSFGVETSWRALASLRAVERRPLGGHDGPFYRRAENGILGLPADILIDACGQVRAAHYGRHADDHWDVDALLALAGPASVRPDAPVTAA